MAETRKTRPVSWVKAALHDFEKFPEGARSVCLAALTIAADGGKAAPQSRCRAWALACSKFALAYRSDAFRVVYAAQLGHDIWVVHAFQKKSTQGIRTPNSSRQSSQPKLSRRSTVNA